MVLSLNSPLSELASSCWRSEFMAGGLADTCKDWSKLEPITLTSGDSSPRWPTGLNSPCSDSNSPAPPLQYDLESPLGARFFQQHEDELSLPDTDVYPADYDAVLEASILSSLGLEEMDASDTNCAIPKSPEVNAASHGLVEPVLPFSAHLAAPVDFQCGPGESSESKASNDVGKGPDTEHSAEPVAMSEANGWSLFDAELIQAKSVEAAFEEVVIQVGSELNGHLGDESVPQPSSPQPSACLVCAMPCYHCSQMRDPWAVYDSELEIGQCDDYDFSLLLPDTLDLLIADAFSAFLGGSIGDG